MHPTTLSVTIRKPLYSIQLFTSYFLPNQGGKKFGLYAGVERSHLLGPLHTIGCACGWNYNLFGYQIGIGCSVYNILFMCHQVQNLTRKCQMQIDKRILETLTSPCMDWAICPIPLPCFCPFEPFSLLSHSLSFLLPPANCLDSTCLIPYKEILFIFVNHSLIHIQK